MNATDTQPAEAAPDDQSETAKPGEGRIPLSRYKVWLRFLRIRVAHAVLLPELTRDEARKLRESVHDDSALTSGYILMCALSAGIATLGLLQSSTAVVIGAMLISPLMSPIAALGFGFASIDGHRIRDAARVVMVGAGIGILTGVLITWASPIRNATPEILARTQPTLLDLAVALFSGIAGGYATVIGKGGTAIGVAIATALMPPLATLGYGLGVLQLRFAIGALLLFLTNLAAITFAFAVIARLSGVARPLQTVEWTPRYTAVLVASFLVLATPLSSTLVRIKHEATMRLSASSAILAATGQKNARIAQLEVSWPLFGEPQVTAVVITPRYSTTAAKDAERLLAYKVGEKVNISLQQVLAANVEAQTQAMVDAAMQRTIAGIAADVPPYDNIRASIGLPARAMWTNRAGRMVYVEPVQAPGWTLADYRAIEKRASAAAEGWTVQVVPPAVPQLRVALDAPPAGGDAQKTGEAQTAANGQQPAAQAVSADLAIWALQRWGMTSVVVTAPEGEPRQALVKALTDAGITVAHTQTPPADQAGSANVAVIGIYAPSPTKLAEEAKAAAAAKAKAEAEAEAKAAAAAQAAATAPAKQ